MTESAFGRLELRVMRQLKGGVSRGGAGPGLGTRLDLEAGFGSEMVISLSKRVLFAPCGLIRPSRPAISLRKRVLFALHGLIRPYRPLISKNP